MGVGVHVRRSGYFFCFAPLTHQPSLHHPPARSPQARFVSSVMHVRVRTRCKPAGKRTNGSSKISGRSAGDSAEPARAHAPLELSEWSCPYCTFRNPALFLCCEVCSSQRPEDVPPSPSRPSPVPLSSPPSPLAVSPLSETVAAGTAETDRIPLLPIDQPPCKRQKTTGSKRTVIDVTNLPETRGPDLDTLRDTHTRSFRFQDPPDHRPRAKRRATSEPAATPAAG